MKKRNLIGAAVLLLLLIAGILLRRRMEELEQRVPEYLEPAEVVYVIDGDTLLVEIEKTEYKVRLIGIDCEESVSHNVEENTEKGRAVSGYVRDLLPEGSRVWLEKDVSETDRYGRLLRYVWLKAPRDGGEEEVRTKMLNGLLVDLDWAKPEDFPPDTKYSGIFWELSREAGTE